MGIISQRKVLLVVARRTLKNCVHHNDYLLERRSSKVDFRILLQSFIKF